MRGIFLALLLLAAAPASLHAANETWEAGARNLALASGFLGAKNACAHDAKQPTADDPFAVASADIVSLVPQADNVTSDLFAPLLLWSWSADYPQEAEAALAGEGGCPAGGMEIYDPGSPRFLEGRLEYSYGNAARTVALHSDGPNPVQLELDGANLSAEDYAELYFPLAVRVSGKVSVSYSYRKRQYFQSCTVAGGYVGCGCEARTETGTRTYERRVQGEKSFGVESGENYLAWLNPPLKTRLDGGLEAKALLFARRLPARISVSASGKELGGNSLYRLTVGAGECGQAVVQSTYSPQESGLPVEKANGTVFPYQLVERNASYLPFYLQFAWDESAGRKELSAAIEDRFSNVRNHSYEFLVRSPSPYAGGRQAAGMQLRSGSEAMTPAAYPARQESGGIPQLGVLGLLLGAGALAAVGGMLPHRQRIE